MLIRVNDYDTSNMYRIDEHKGEMIFLHDRYKNQSEMYNDIGQFLNLILKNDNIATIHQEEDICTVIRYSHDDNIDYFGGATPVWLSDEEEQLVLDYRNEVVNKIKESQEVK